MTFVQVIEVTTSRYDEFVALHEQWKADTEGKRTAISERICRDRARPDTYFVIVEFPSYEAAMENNALPETETIAKGMAALADSPPVFRDLDVVLAE